MTLIEILCNRTRICRPAGASRSRCDAPLFLLEVLFGAHYAVTRPALVRARSACSTVREPNLNYAANARKARFKIA